MNDFVFQSPGVLGLLLLTLPLAWLLAFARKRRRDVIAAMGGGVATHRLTRDMLRLVAFALLIGGLARPGYSPVFVPVSMSGRDVVFVLDVSRSMLAQDVPPSRLEVAKQAIRDALATMTDQRAGLVVYAGSASILCPLTHDYEFVRCTLEQANPRTVDFGGTALQSAVEKAVDQVLMAGREGVQDLIVLTDGGDTDSNIPAMIALLQEKQVDVLVVGIGDPDNGSPIPAEPPPEGSEAARESTPTVFTKLEDAALRSFAALTPRVEYVAAGIRPFNLGEIYGSYAMGRKSDAAASGDGIVVYKEAAGFFLIAALMLLLLAELNGRKIGTMAVLLAMGLFPFPAMAATVPFSDAFQSAVKLVEGDEFQKAEEVFSDIYQNMSNDTATATELAVVQFNRGICLTRLAESLPDEAASEALANARQAQLAFLAAKRATPDMVRAGMRVEMTTSLVSRLMALVAKQEEADRTLQEEMANLVERLKELQKQQDALRASVAEADVPRRPPPATAPADAVANAAEFSSHQSKLGVEASAIEVVMVDLDRKLSVPVAGGTPAKGFMTEPLELMAQVREIQTQAAQPLTKWQDWPHARSMQQEASDKITKILEFFAGDSDQQADDEEMSDEMDESGEESDSDSEAMPSSEKMQGDLAAGADMQPLPKPNYSAEDILTEEKGSLQFREQKRASGNAGKVEKDY